jgi:hypothetical protein
MVDVSKKNEVTRLYRDGEHPLPNVAEPHLKRTVTSDEKFVECSGLGLIWDNSPEFVQREWGETTKNRRICGLLVEI